MRLFRNAYFVLALGAALVALLAIVASRVTGPALTARLAAQATEAIAEAGGAPIVARFSTMTFWLSGCLSLSASLRARASVGPPGGKGTISVTGRAAG